MQYKNQVVHYIFKYQKSKNGWQSDYIWVEIYLISLTNL